MTTSVEKITDEFVTVDITTQELIGEGAFGTVHLLGLATATGRTGTQVAKVLKKTDTLEDNLLIESIGHELRVSRVAASRLGENAPVVDESGVYVYTVHPQNGELAIVQILSSVDALRESLQSSDNEVNRVSNTGEETRWGIQSTFAGRPLKEVTYVSRQETITAYLKIAAAFTKAAKRGLGTTDISGGNILINEKGGVELIDFGGYSALLDISSEDLYSLAIYNTSFLDKREQLLFLLYIVAEDKLKRNVRALSAIIEGYSNSEVDTMILQIQYSLLSAGKQVFSDSGRLGGLSPSEFLALFLERSETSINWNCPVLRDKATMPPMLKSGEFTIRSPQTVNPALIGTLVDARCLWQLNLVHTFEVVMLFLKQLGVSMYPYGFSLESGETSYTVSEQTQGRMVTSIWGEVFGAKVTGRTTEVISLEEFKVLCTQTMLAGSDVRGLYNVLSSFWKEYWEVMVACSKSSFDTEINPTILMQQISSAMAEPSEV